MLLLVLLVLFQEDEPLCLDSQSLELWGTETTKCSLLNEVTDLTHHQASLRSKNSPSSTLISNTWSGIWFKSLVNPILYHPESDFDRGFIINPIIPGRLGESGLKDKVWYLPRWPFVPDVWMRRSSSLHSFLQKTENLAEELNLKTEWMNLPSLPLRIDVLLSSSFDPDKEQKLFFWPWAAAEKHLKEKWVYFCGDWDSEKRPLSSVKGRWFDPRSPRAKVTSDSKLSPKRERK